ncbi:MAG: deoxyribodipyrimidine photolyase [Cyclobacteriaceae bacterium]
MNFPTDYQSIVDRMESIDPLGYGATRNFADGAVTRLSPYISRGVISTKQVYQSIISRGFSTQDASRLIQELAWRDYWQQVWIAKGNLIDNDLKQPQEDTNNFQLSQAILKGETGILAVDKAIEEFYDTGYMHNHMRMYVASLACNIAKSHWKLPAQWMYYHLLDADWASNSLSWQWVAGSNSHKKYFANQENINTYFDSDQKDTFLDVPYESFDKMKVPAVLASLCDLELESSMPKTEPLRVNRDLPTYLYNFYNLDPMWEREVPANRILLLEPSVFSKYPVSTNSIEFMLDLAQNIPQIQVFVGSFEELVGGYQLKNIRFKEHPLSAHYVGQESARDWIFSVKGYFPSFFAFWKKCKKELPEIKSNTMSI